MISATLDHSKSFGPARHQGMRLTCLAFAVSDLNQLVSGAPDILSPEFLYQMAGSRIQGWVPGSGLYLIQTLGAAARPGQPLETDFPYQAAATPVATAPTVPAGTQLFASQLQPLDPRSVIVCDHIKRGSAVGLIVECTDTLYKPVDGVVTFTPMILPNRAHAVLAVGLGKSSAGEDHVLVRNSWGSAWGVNGYAWLPMQYIDMHAREAFGR
jgi:hypothetical protein